MDVSIGLWCSGVFPARFFGHVIRDAAVQAPAIVAVFAAIVTRRAHLGSRYMNGTMCAPQVSATATPTAASVVAAVGAAGAVADIASRVHAAPCRMEAAASTHICIASGTGIRFNVVIWFSLSVSADFRALCKGFVQVCAGVASSGSSVSS